MFKYILRQVRLLSNARKEPYLQFYHILGFYPDNIDYYQLAVRHRSMTTSAASGHILSNERLEFLGDAVLNSVVTDILFTRYERQREGFLTNTRSKLVKREYLNQLALEMGMDKIVVKSKHIAHVTNSNIYGNAFEALIGAIYLDYGYKQCKRFVEKRLFKTFIDLDKVVIDEKNYKSKIIEYCQKYHLTYEFVLLDESVLTANNHIFYTRLLIDGKTICEATGPSKKESQQNASYKAYCLIQETPDFIKDLIIQAEEVPEISKSTTEDFSI
ncbi:MAG: ribonuclease III [Paludibacter sp.]|nr:ribonuclease III [Paludibacter sp.]